MNRNLFNNVALLTEYKQDFINNMFRLLQRELFMI